jgi:hypothetical protein
VGAGTAALGGGALAGAGTGAVCGPASGGVRRPSHQPATAAMAATSTTDAISRVDTAGSGRRSRRFCAVRARWKR